MTGNNLENLKAHPLECEVITKAILASILDAVVLVNHQGNIIFWNHAAERMFGYNEIETLGKNLNIFLSPSSCQMDLERRIAMFQESGTVNRTENIVESIGMTRRGKEFPIEIAVSAFEFDEIGGAILFIRNITDRVETRQILERTQQKQNALSTELEAILDHIPALVFFKDEENNYLRVNQFVAEAHEMSKDDLAGMNLFDLFPREKAQAEWEDDLEVIQSGKSKLNADEPWTTDQGTRWFTTSKIPYYGDNGEIHGIIGISLDITDRVLAQEKLKESEERYRNMFDSVPVSIWEEDFSSMFSEVNELTSRTQMDLETYLEKNPQEITRLGDMIKVRDVNPQTLRMFEANEKSELLGSLENIFIPETNNILRDEILAFHEGNRFFQGETVNRTLRGKRLDVLLTMAVPKEVEGAKNVLISMMDISKRKKLEREIQQLATEDPLVRCYNRRYFTSYAKKELDRALRYQRPLSIIMIDIDHFKAINDRYGHLVGDEVLIVFAERMKPLLRSTDIFARYGGEEFVILLPETKLEDARKIAERLRIIAAEPFLIDQRELKISISLGAASLDSGANVQIETLVDRADQALFSAKENGRNQVITWPLNPSR